jgi:hypothetical protein
MTRQRGIDQFTRENWVALRKNNNHESELASLRLVDRQCIGQLKRGIALFAKIAGVEIVRKSRL